MNSKAIKRQLLAAIAMVLVAALALGSSTFAWFANNNVVEATGMSVAAQTEGSLLVISDSTTLGTETTKAFNLTGSNLFPTHLTTTIGNAVNFTGDSSTWTHSFSKEYKSAITDTEHTADSETKLSLSLGSGSGNVFGTETPQNTTQYYDTNGKQYFLAGDIYIGLDNKNTSASCGPISLTDYSISGSADFLKSARVALVNAGTYSAQSSTFTDANTLKGIVGQDGKLKTPGNYYTPDELEALGTGIAITDSGLKAGEYVKIAVYIYFDGRDNACTSEKFDTTQTQVTLTFTAEEV